MAPAVRAAGLEERDSFRILRRTRRADDEMSTDAKHAFGDRSSFGRNNDLSMAIEASTGKGWVVPGRNALCLIVPDPSQGFGATCQATTDAKRGDLVMTFASPESRTVQLTAVLPDGARQPTVRMADGTIRELRPTPDGVVSETLNAPITFSLRTPSGIATQDISRVVERAISVDCGAGRIVPVASETEIGGACD
ncbi:MAG TPA: hypothetical protein VF533_01330 [Solirubrobacteraceae bacterium]